MSIKLTGIKSLVKIGNIEHVIKGFWTMESNRVPVFPVETGPTHWNCDFKVEKFNYEDDSTDEEEPFEYGDCYD